MGNGIGKGWRIAPQDELETFLFGCLVILLALLLGVGVTLSMRDDRGDEIDARSRVLSFVLEMSQVAKGVSPIEVANNPARPFGLVHVGARASVRSVALKGEFEGRSLVVEAHRVTRAECIHLGRMLKGGEDSMGLLDGVSVNGSGFMESGFFQPEACRPDTAARGSGRGLPENVVRIRLATPKL